MIGRPPVPEEVLKARGTYRKDRHGNRPESNGNKPTCPDILKGEAKREWTRLIGHVERLRILDENDRGLLAAFCMAWGKLHYAERREGQLQEEAEEVSAELSKAADKEAKAELRKRLDRLDNQLRRTDVSWGRAYNAFIKAADRLGVGAIARARASVEKVSTQPDSGKGRFFNAVG